MPATSPREAADHGGRFVTTHWSVVLRAGQAGSPDAMTALERLYLTYRYPLYAFVRRQGHDPETTEDVVQEVFLALVQKNQLAAVGPEKGRFRSYLLAAANHLLANEWHKRNRQKRGGGRAPIALDGLAAEARYRIEPVDDRAPDLLFERRWALALLDSVFARLRGEWQAADKGPIFDVLRVFLSSDQDAPGFAAVGAQLGWTDGATRVAVHRLRKQYRDLLREEIASTVESETEVDDEIRHLLAALRR